MKKLAILSMDAVRIPLLPTAPNVKIENGEEYDIRDKCTRATALGQRLTFFADELSKYFDVTVLVPDLNYPPDNAIDYSKINYTFKPYNWFDANWHYSEYLAQQFLEYDIIIMQSAGGVGFLNGAKLPSHIILCIDACLPFPVEYKKLLDIYPPDKQGEYYQMGMNQYKQLMNRADLLIYANDRQRNFYEGLFIQLSNYNTKFMNDMQFIKVQNPIADRYIPERKMNSTYQFLWYGGIYPWYAVDKVFEMVDTFDNISITFSGVLHPRFKKIRDNFYREYHDRLLNHPKISIDYNYYDGPTTLFSMYDATIVMAQEGMENSYSNRSRILDSISYGLPVITNKTNPLHDEPFLADVLVPYTDIHDMDSCLVKLNDIADEDFYNIYQYYTSENCFNDLICRLK